MTLQRLALTAVIFCGISSTVAAECDPGDTEALKWLDRMSHSLRETSYSGVFTYQSGAAVQTMRISHSVRGNVESEHMTRLTGTETRVVRTRHPLDCIHPGHKLVRIGQSYTGPGKECGLAAHYRLKMAGSQRIAGRDAVIMDVLPRDRYRYGYQMALDRETGLLLKSQTVAEDGKVLERFQFADVSIGVVQVEGTRVEVIHEAAHPGHGAGRREIPESSRGWTVRWLPEGFMMTDNVEHTMHNRTFTDGLATFSVFVEPLSRLDSPGAGKALQGGTTVYTRGLLISGAPALVTVLGEVPVNTARRVADSVSWSNVAAQ